MSATFLQLANYNSIKTALFQVAYIEIQKYCDTLGVSIYRIS